MSNLIKISDMMKLIDIEREREIDPMKWLELMDEEGLHVDPYLRKKIIEGFDKKDE